MQSLVAKSSLRIVITLQTVLLMTACAGLPTNEVGKEKVILVHGYGRSTSAMNDYQSYFEKLGPALPSLSTKDSAFLQHLRRQHST